MAGWARPLATAFHRIHSMTTHFCSTSFSARLWAFFGACLALLLVVQSGCGKQLPAGKTKIYGTVTVDGQPLSFAGEGIFSITFVAREGSEVAGNALDRTDGSFELVLSPGDYTAVVTATDGFGEEPRPGKIIPPKSLIPIRYGSQDTSDAVVTVPPTGGQVTVALRSK